MDVLIIVFCCCGLTIEIFSIAIDNLMGHGLALHFGPINFRCRSLILILACFVRGVKQFLVIVFSFLQNLENFIAIFIILSLHFEIFMG